MRALVGAAARRLLPRRRPSVPNQRRAGCRAPFGRSRGAPKNHRLIPKERILYKDVVTYIGALMGVTRGIAKSLTGIDGFDELTLGGLPRGRPTLVCGGAGCGKTLFASTFLIRGARDFDEPGVFVTFEERPADIISNVASLGFGLDQLVADNKVYIEHVQVDPSEVAEIGDYDL